MTRTSVRGRGGGLTVADGSGSPPHEHEGPRRLPIIRTDEIPESGQTNYSITYAAGDLPNGNFTVRVSSFLTGSIAWTSSTATQRTGNKESVLQLVTPCG